METGNAVSKAFYVKPVFGKGRERRWKSFQRIFDQSCAKYYPENLLKNAEDRRDVKYRLLKAGSHDKGILIYRPVKLGVMSANSKCFRVELFHVCDTRYFDSFFRKILSLAKKDHAKSVCIEASTMDVDALEKLEQSIFQEDRQDGSSSDIRVFSHQLLKQRKTPTNDGSKRSRGKRERDGNTVSTNRVKREKAEKVDRCPIKRKYFNFIRDGSKTVEGRINSYPFHQWKKGKVVDFFCGRDSVRCEVVAINKYDSFGEMLKAEGVKTCLPDVHSVTEGANVYDRIPRYTEKARNNGVLGIQIARI